MPFPFVVAMRETGGAVKYLLLICGDESAAAHADEGCGTIEIRQLWLP